MWRGLQQNAVVDNGTAGRHCGLRTIYIKHNLFQSSKLEQDFELQNTNIVLSKSLRNLMQVSALLADLGLGQELVDWCGYATSVPYGHLLIELSQTIDYVTDKLWIGFMKRLCSWTLEAFEVFARWTHKISLLCNCSIQFLKSAKNILFSVVQKSLSGFFSNP